MHTSVLKAIALLIAFAALAVVPVRAQGHDVVLADVPFSFVVGHTTLPQGKYRIGRASLTSNAISIRSVEDDAAAFVLTQGSVQGDEPSGARLVFNQYGDTHFLSQIWTSGSLTGTQIAISDSEREMADLGAERGQVTLLVKAR